MSALRIILASLPSVCQKLSQLVEVWQRSGKNNFAQFFLRHGVNSLLCTIAKQLTLSKCDNDYTWAKQEKIRVWDINPV